MGRLDGKVALITGAARGQGEAEARLFVAEGARVVIADVLDAEGAEVAQSLGAAAAYVHLDVTSEDDWSAALAAADAAFGALHVLVNNAGILKFNQLANMSTADFRRVLEVNLVGAFLGIRACAPAIEASGGGAIVNISSTGGLMGIPAAGAYVASKWGVTGLTKTAAMELGPKGIRVNSVHPGGIDTPMTNLGALTPEDFAPYYERLPIRRLGTPDDVAPVVLFLASDEAAYCTGAAFVVDGGQMTGDLGILG